MSYSRDRYEAALEVVSDAAKAGRVSESCVGCLATRGMCGAAIGTGLGPEIEGAQNTARGYMTVIEGCAGVEDCQGTAYIDGTAAVAAALPPAQQ